MSESVDRNSIKVLTESAVESTSRSRRFFTVTLLLSALHMIASYNLYGSWLRRFSMMEAISDNAVVAANQLELMRQWVQSTFICIPVLGIRIHVSDASLAGSITVFFFVLATMFSMRKQNHSIGQASRKAAQSKNLRLMRHAYYRISGDMIFNPMTDNDRPIDSLTFPIEEGNAARISGIRIAIAFLYYIPFAAIALSFICDVVSIFWLHSPFRPGHITVGQMFEEDGISLVMAVFMLMVALVLMLMTLFLGNKCREYQQANNRVLQQLSSEIQKADVQQGRS